MSFTGKVVIVTGASAGIGATTAIEFAKQGADVAIIGRNETKLKLTAEEIKKVGKSPLVIKADVSKDEDAKSIIQLSIKKYGRLDVLVNNAGIMKDSYLLEENMMESYDETLNTNLRAAVHLTSLAAPFLIKSKGNVINISSVLGQVINGMSNRLAYCVSKAGLTHFSRAAAMQLASYGVRVNTISPGPVATDMLANPTINFNEITPLKRVSEAVEVADVILFLASERAKGITGSNYGIDNGMFLV